MRVQLMIEDHGYWYLASYPKSGNTWCRVFITELLRLAGDDPGKELNLNQDIETGAIASSRFWLDDQLGVNSCDLSFSELDPLRSSRQERSVGECQCRDTTQGESQIDGSRHHQDQAIAILIKGSI